MSNGLRWRLPSEEMEQKLLLNRLEHVCDYCGASPYTETRELRLPWVPYDKVDSDQPPGVRIRHDHESGQAQARFIWLVLFCDSCATRFLPLLGSNRPVPGRAVDFMLQLVTEWGEVVVNNEP